VAEEAIAVLEPESVVRDDLLRPVFTCCHPALSIEARVALALRTLAGLEVAAISRAFLVPEATMAKRLLRARQKIAAAQHYEVPDDDLQAALDVMYAHIAARRDDLKTGMGPAPLKRDWAGDRNRR
jgi:predicted RNA polymerase sigma factor